MARFANTKAATVETNNSGFEKATAFLNVYIQNGDKRHKVGAIPLKNSKAYEAALIQRLNGDADALTKMQAVMQLDFQMVSTEPVPVDSLGF